MNFIIFFGLIPVDVALMEPVPKQERSNDTVYEIANTGGVPRPELLL